MAAGPVPQLIGARLAQRLDLSADCWLWRGSHNGSGYGQIAVKTDGKWAPKYVHRMVFEALIGPIPKGMTLDHLCRTPACANPAHLEIVTEAENIRRAWRDRPLRTHCNRGHPFTADNLLKRKRDPEYRECLTCHNARTARARDRARVNA